MRRRSGRARSIRGRLTRLEPRRSIWRRTDHVVQPSGFSLLGSCSGSGFGSDAVDRGYITEDVRREHDPLAEAALQEVTGLMEYLQSPEPRSRAAHCFTSQSNKPPNSEQRTLEPRT